MPDDAGGFQREAEGEFLGFVCDDLLFGSGGDRGCGVAGPLRSDWEIGGLMTMWQMYWLTRLDSISQLTTGIIIACVVIFFLTLSFIDESRKPIKFVGVPSLIFGAFTLCIGAFIPTSKEMAAILIVPKIVNNAKVQEVPDKLMTLATEWLEELRPSKKE